MRMGNGFMKIPERLLFAHLAKNQSGKVPKITSVNREHVYSPWCYFKLLLVSLFD